QEEAVTEIVIEDEWYLYVLFDPLTETAFYIGMTANPKGRLAAHNSESTSPVFKRCGAIRSQGAKALMKIIARTQDYRLVREWEGQMIWEYAGRTINRAGAQYSVRPFHERDLKYRRGSSEPKIIAIR